MQLLRTVLLRHRMPGGHHYDWMLEPPASDRRPADRLLTWRVGLPSWHWRRNAAGAVLPLDELPSHRRAYLQRTGPVSGRRGSVQRVDAGTAILRHWHIDGGWIELHMQHFTGLIHLVRHPGLRWQMQVLGDSPACLPANGPVQSR